MEYEEASQEKINEEFNNEMESQINSLKTKEKTLIIIPTIKKEKQQILQTFLDTYQLLGIFEQYDSTYI